MGKTWLRWFEYTGTPAKMGQIRQTADTVVTAESASKPDRDYGYYRIDFRYYSGDIAWPVHDGTCNVLWADAHVTGVRVSGGTTEVGAANLYKDGVLGSLIGDQKYNKWDRQ